jgi:hypothetical protein
MSHRVLVNGGVVSFLKLTATGTSAVCELEQICKVFTMQTVATGGATVSITLQGSLDGTNWTTLATSTSATGDQQYAVDKPQKYLRVNLGTLTGGTAPTVTAYVAASV